MDNIIHDKNIAVVGAGILGLMNACALSRVGHRVTLYDPAGFPGRNASFLAGGMLAPYSEIEHMPMPYVQAGLESIALWRSMMPGFNVQVDFAQEGSLFIAHGEDAYMMERFAAHLPDSAKWRRVARDDLGPLEPQLAGRFSSGLFLEEEAHIYPEQAMVALVEMLHAQGVELREEAVDDLSALSLHYDYVIDCRGYGAEGDDPDLRGVKGELALVENKEFSLKRPVRLMHPRYPLYIVPRPDDVFMIGATVIESGDDEGVSVRSAMELMSALYSLHPSFGEARVIDLLAGVRPSYMDNLPRIRCRGNIVSCNGSFRHGYLLAPAMARDVCEIVERQDVDSVFIEPVIEEKVA